MVTVFAAAVLVKVFVMPTDISIRCKCAALRGTLHEVSGDHGNRLVCYCDDCQSFAYFLGGSNQILDAHGGTDIFQTSPARMELTSGLEHLACMSLKPGGLIRWYADCCRTPIGNTLATRQSPFVGVIHSCTPVESNALSRDAVFGPARAHPSALREGRSLPPRSARPRTRPWDPAIDVENPRRTAAWRSCPLAILRRENRRFGADSARAQHGGASRVD